MKRSARWRPAEAFIGLACPSRPTRTFDCPLRAVERSRIQATAVSGGCVELLVLGAADVGGLAAAQVDRADHRPGQWVAKVARIGCKVRRPCGRPTSALCLAWSYTRWWVGSMSMNITC
jgi:hypothetical protein